VKMRYQGASQIIGLDLPIENTLLHIIDYNQKRSLLIRSLE
jgi:hypothetical protein